MFLFKKKYQIYMCRFLQLFWLIWRRLAWKYSYVLYIYVDGKMNAPLPYDTHYVLFLENLSFLTTVLKGLTVCV